MPNGLDKFEGSDGRCFSPSVSAQLQPKATGTLGFLKHLDFEKWLETKLLVLKLLDYLKSSEKKYRYKSIDI